MDPKNSQFPKMTENDKPSTFGLGETKDVLSGGVPRASLAADNPRRGFQPQGAATQGPMEFNTTPEGKAAAKKHAEEQKAKGLVEVYDEFGGRHGNGESKWVPRGSVKEDYDDPGKDRDYPRRDYSEPPLVDPRDR